MSKAAEDEDVQKRGIVMIYYANAQKIFDNRNNRPVHVLNALKCLPARVVAAHFCYDHPGIRPLLDLLSDKMEKEMLCRFRSHYGQHAECLYNLKAFGIPSECLPIDTMGQVDLTNHKLFLESINTQEQQLKTSGGNECSSVSSSSSTTKVQLMAHYKIVPEKCLIPGHLDIILGRGQHAKNTPGHLRFKQLLENHQARYESAEKSQKSAVAGLVLNELKSAGCRFLKPRPEGGWVQVSDDAGREKINHAFRNLRNTTSKKPAPQTSSRKRKMDSDPFYA